MKKLFGGINFTWKKLIIFAIITGVYTGIVAMIPTLKDTSFQDISISFEWWILFGTLIIVNSKSNKEAAIKCFIFFLISQPLVYLVQVPFNRDGWGIFRYYPGWFRWTLLTIPMGYIGYYLKKDKWWGLIILTPLLFFLGYHYASFLGETRTYFPYRSLSTIFCFVTLIIYPLFIFNNKKVKISGLVISILIIIGMTLLVFIDKKHYYNTTILLSGAIMEPTNEQIDFDDTYSVYLKDSDYGTLTIGYEENLEAYKIDATFKKIGQTEIILESPNGEKYVFDIKIERTSYNIKLKN